MAAMSATTVRSGCAHNAEAGTAGSGSPSSIAASAAAFASPTASNNNERAASTVAMPWVIARCGTLSGAAKNRALSARVVAASATTRVRLSNGVPGSLKPMCPLRPIPSTCTSTPPRRAISAS